MGRPPSNGAPSFRFNPTEVAQMEAILQKHEGHVPPRDLLVALAERFSNSPDRAGKAVVVQMKQVWNWFQNRRYALRAKLVKSPGKSNTSPVTRDEVTPMRIAPSIPHQMAVSSGPHMVRNASEAPQMEFEAKSARDGAWYDVQAFLSHRFLETDNPEVLVRFSGFGPEEDEWVNIRMHCRQRSLPCEASECIAVLPGDLILCFQEGKEQALYFDAHVFDAQRRRHDVRGCRCRFLVRYDHDQSEEIVQLRKICRRPETDYRLQLLHAANEAASTAVSAEHPTPVVDLTSSSPMKMSNPISSSAAIAALPPPVGSGAGPFARPPAVSQAPIPTLVRAPVPGSIVSSSASPSPVKPLAASPSPIWPPAPSPSPIRPPAPSPSLLGPPAASPSPIGHSPTPPGFPASVINPATSTSVVVPTATGPGFPVSAPFPASATVPVSAHFSAPVTVAVPEAPPPAIEPKEIKSEIPAQVPVPEPQKVKSDNPAPPLVPAESVGVGTENPALGSVPVPEQMKVEPNNQAVSPLPMPEPNKVESEVPDQVSEPVPEPAKIEGDNIAPVSVPKPNKVESDNQVPVTEPNKVESDNQVPVPEPMEVENEDPVTVPEPMEVENENPVTVPEPIGVENEKPVTVPEPTEVENENPVPAPELLEIANTNAVPVPKPDNVETVNLGTLVDEAGGQTNVTPVAANKVQESEEAENNVPAAELTGGSASQGQLSYNPTVTVPGQEMTASSAPNNVALEGSVSAGDRHNSTETANSSGEH